MPGIRIRIPQTTGPIGPVVPADLHSNGVPGATHRYVTYPLPTADGSPVAALYDAIGAAHLLPVGTTLPVIATTVSGVKVAQLPANSLAGLQTTIDLGQDFTIAALLSVGSNNQPIFADGYKFGRGGDTNFSAYGGATGTTAAGLMGPGLNGFVIVFFNHTAANTNAFGYKKAADSALPTNTTTPNSAWADMLALKGTGSTADARLIELNTWPTALTWAQMGDHETALRAKYGALIATY